MVLADTSAWVEHFRRRNERLAALLDDGLVVVHDFVIGELALGELSPREEILGLLHSLPHSSTADHQEVLGFVERERLWGRGIGWIDAHLLASARLDRLALLTLDRRLAGVASDLGVSAVP